MIFTGDTSESSCYEDHDTILPGLRYNILLFLHRPVTIFCNLVKREIYTIEGGETLASLLRP